MRIVSNLSFLTWPIAFFAVVLGSTTIQAQENKSRPAVPGIQVSASPTMLEIPVSRFKMGGNPHHDEKAKTAESENRLLSVYRRDMSPKHNVIFEHKFEMSATEVTQEQWTAVMGSNPSYHQDCGPTCPVERVSWFDAISFANQLSAKNGLEICYVMSGKEVSWPKGYDCKGYRLPTEAEWEAAARSPIEKTAEDRGPRYVSQFAWMDRNSNDTTHPVATRKADSMGLYDMRGNVWEWTWDRYGRYNGGKNVGPKGAKKGKRRVYRGGSAFNGFDENSRKYRAHWLPDGRDMNIGFRLARSID